MTDSDISTIQVLPGSPTEALRNAVAEAQRRYTLIVSSRYEVIPDDDAIAQLREAMEHSGALMAYADYRVRRGNEVTDMPVIDMQEGSLRDDFDFGPVMLVDTAALADAVRAMPDYKAAALYDLRLRLTDDKVAVRVTRPLSTVCEDVAARREGEEQFDYVDPRNRSVQVELEQAATDALRRRGALLQDAPADVDVGEGEFAVEASVVIPVKNRVRTVVDAVSSALSQVADFPYNVIVVDNHSDDGTTELLRERFGNNQRFVHIIPEETGLGIGGCWNKAVESEHCGRFAVQLDSDDCYSAPDVLARIVDTFRRERCGMVVGSYMLTDFDLNPIPPGVIDHREWTDTNGRNNLLRVNGMGAPRAFYTPLVRACRFPDVSYGEDYAVALWFSRTYRIGRIYDVLYHCRRWEGNSDSSISRERLNANNRYKDSLRTAELSERKKLLSR